MLPSPPCSDPSSTISCSHRLTMTEMALLSVVPALARLEVDPWKEAAGLARAQGTGEGATNLAHCVLAEGLDGESVAQGNRRSPDCPVTTAGKLRYGRACDAVSSRPHSAFTFIRRARRSRPLAGRLFHLHGASCKCAGRHGRCACYGKRTRGSTLGPSARARRIGLAGL
jgi:hypothetical protein